MTPSRRIAAIVTTPLLAMFAVAALAELTPSYAGTASTSATAHSASQPRTDQLALSKGYTYWGYYTWNAKKKSWDYATVGANDRTKLPADGDVYGFRWALVVNNPRLPRAAGDFDAICGSEQAGSGEKRVALVIDPGTTSDAVGSDETPPAEGLCAVVKESFTVQQALESLVPIRTGNGGLICGIDGYPSQGCGDTIPDAKEPPTDQPVQLILPNAAPTESASTDQPGSESAVSPKASSADSAGSGSSMPILLTIAIVVILIIGALVVRRRRS